ncbi:hypothetical protein BB561_001396 [Smittium simulii]|uniref:Peptidase M16 N-terminal domain-containing protein n=1 Tax=Smittium simulii TaxID=133385 RepID=A0A2T9YUU7_9FUNG|nr:hypothetical protein BB561_001396 [Smittium simulii]
MSSININGIAPTKTTDSNQPGHDCPTFTSDSLNSMLDSLELSESFETKLSDQGVPYYEFIEAPIVKSYSDNRDYKYIKLQNGLIALIGQDLMENISCAAMNVKVGSISDPPEYLGLAHFCEHMLFMGTKKYPQENEYSKYLSMHGGHSNAYTDTENTCYYFDVSQNEFEGALDRFAQFFISPLFDSDCVEREVKAVDSEYKKNLQNDWWRLHQLEKSLLDSNHPYNQFSSGNHQTLIESAKARGEDLREQLINFYNLYYSSDIMRLVIIGKEDLDELANWVVNKFSDIQSKGITYKSPKYHPLTDKCLKKLIVSKSIRDNRYLKLVFPFPDSQMYYKTKPAYYLTNLIGHESEGSILSCLQFKGWATDIVASYSSSYGGDFGAFKVLVSLTEEGYENYKSVIHIIFAYIKLIKQSGPQEWYFDELMKTSHMDFRFEEKKDAISFATNASTNLHRQLYPPQLIISAPSLFYEFNPEPIKERINLLNSNNYRVLLSTNNPKFSNSEKEKYYDVEYEVTELSKDLNVDMNEYIDNLPKEILSMLKVPQPNRFIPEDLEVINKKGSEPVSVPSLLLKNDKIELWFKQDDRFYLPRGIVNISISVPGIYSSPQTALLSNLFAELFYDQTKRITYDAKVAGFRFSLNTVFNAVELIVEGYNDKLVDLITVLLQYMRNLEINEERYKICLDEVVRRLENNSHSEPWNQAGLAYNYFKFETQWRYTDKLIAAKNITINHMKNFTEKLFDQAYFKVLVLGNYTEKGAVEISNTILKNFQSNNYLTSERTFNRNIKYQNGHFIHVVKSHSEKNLNSSVMRLLYASSPTNHYERAILGLISSMAQEPFFDQVRTKEQLGYIVASQCNIMNDSPMCLLFLVQSECNPSFIDLRIDNFIKFFTKFIETLTPLQLDKYIRALVNKRETKPKYIREEAMNFWNQIKSGYYEFTWTLTDISYLQKLTVKKITQFWNDYINPKSALSSHLSIHIYSSFYQLPNSQQFKKYPSTILSLEGCLIHSGGDPDLVSNQVLIEYVSKTARDLGLESIQPQIIKNAIAQFAESYEKKAEKRVKELKDNDSIKEYESNKIKFIKSLKKAESSTEHINIAFSMALEEFNQISNSVEGQFKKTPEPNSGPYLLNDSETLLDDNVDANLTDQNTMKEKLYLGRGLIKTPNNSYVFFDPVKYKNTSELISGPISYHDLQPKLE